MNINIVIWVCDITCILTNKIHFINFTLKSFIPPTYLNILFIMPLKKATTVHVITVCGLDLKSMKNYVSTMFYGIINGLLLHILSHGCNNRKLFIVIPICYKSTSFVFVVQILFSIDQTTSQI